MKKIQLLFMLMFKWIFIFISMTIIFAILTVFFLSFPVQSDQSEAKNIDEIVKCLDGFYADQLMASDVCNFNFQYPLQVSVLSANAWYWQVLILVTDSDFRSFYSNFGIDDVSANDVVKNNLMYSGDKTRMVIITEDYKECDIDNPFYVYYQYDKQGNIEVNQTQIVNGYVVLTSAIFDSKAGKAVYKISLDSR